MSDGVSNGKCKKEKKYIMLIIERVVRRPGLNWMSCRIMLRVLRRFLSYSTARLSSSIFILYKKIVTFFFYPVELNTKLGHNFLFFHFNKNFLKISISFFFKIKYSLVQKNI